MSETCRVSCQNNFVKLVHLVGFIIKKFVTMQHGHMNVQKKLELTLLKYMCKLVNICVSLSNICVSWSNICVRYSNICISRSIYV
jgi:hypothetical protein